MADENKPTINMTFTNEEGKICVLDDNLLSALENPKGYENFSLKDIEHYEWLLNQPQNISDELQNKIKGILGQLTKHKESLESKVKDFFEKDEEKIGFADICEAKKILAGKENENKKIDDIIINKSIAYGEDKNVIVSMNDTYQLRDWLEEIDEKSDEETKTKIAPALSKTKETIGNFEEYYGIDKESLLPAEKVEQNLETVKQMGGYRGFFAREGFDGYKPTPAYDTGEISDVVARIKHDDKDIPSLPALSAALQGKYDKDDAALLIESAKKRIAATKESDFKNPNDIADYEFLLGKVAESDSKAVTEKHRKLLYDAKQKHESQYPLKYPEFKEIADILNRMEFEGELKRFSREKVGVKKSADYKDAFLDQVFGETKTYLTNTCKDEITPEMLAEEYASRLQLNILQLVHADNTLKGRMSKEEIEEEFKKLVEGKKPIKINQTSMAAHQAVSLDNLETVGKQYEQKPTYQNVAKQHQKTTQRLERKNKNTFGKGLWNAVKIVMKSGGWGIAYSVGASFGPAGIAVVGAASFANNAWGMFKDYKRQKAEGKVTGFWNYIKNNKMRALSCCLSATSCALGGLNAAQIIADPAMFTLARTAVSSSMMALGGATVVKQVSNAVKNAPEGKKFTTGLKTAVLSGGGFALGIMAGRTAGAMTQDYIHGADNELIGPEPQDEMIGPPEPDYLKEVGRLPDKIPASLAECTTNEQKVLYFSSVWPDKINNHFDEVHSTNGWAQEYSQMSDADKVEWLRFAEKHFSPDGKPLDGNGGIDTEYQAKIERDWDAQQERMAAKVAAEQQPQAPQPKNTGPTLEAVKDPKIEVKVESNAEKPDPIAEKHQQMMAENQANNNFEINKIKLVNSETGEYKVVGEINGDRFTLDTKDISLNDMGERDTDVNKVKFNDDGSMSLKGVSEGGRDFSMNFDKDGNITKLSVEGKEVSEEALETMNKTGIYKDLYEELNQVKETDGWSIDKNNPENQDGQGDKGASANPPAPEVQLDIEIKDEPLDVDDKELTLKTKSGAELAEELGIKQMEVPNKGDAGAPTDTPEAPKIELDIEIKDEPLDVDDKELTLKTKSGAELAKELGIKQMEVSNKGDAGASAEENQDASVGETIYAPEKWVNSSKGAIFNQCNDLIDDAYYNHETKQVEIINPDTKEVISSFSTSKGTESQAELLDHIRNELRVNLMADEEKYCNLPKDNLTEEQIEFKAKHDEMMAKIGLARNEEGRLVNSSADTPEAPKIELDIEIKDEPIDVDDKELTLKTKSGAELAEELGVKPMKVPSNEGANPPEASEIGDTVFDKGNVKIIQTEDGYVIKAPLNNELVNDIKEEFKLYEKEDRSLVYKTRDGAVIAKSWDMDLLNEKFNQEIQKLAESEQAYREVSQIPKENRTEDLNKFMEDHESKMHKYGLEHQEGSNDGEDLIRTKKLTMEEKIALISGRPLKGAEDPFPDRMRGKFDPQSNNASHTSSFKFNIPHGNSNG